MDAETSRLARATVSGVVALPWNLARNAHTVELRVPSDFFSSLLLLCFCVLHVLRHFVQWNWCITAMCSTVAHCNSIVFGNSVSQIAVEWLHQGVSKGTWSPVVSCDCIVFCNSFLADRSGTATSWMRFEC